MARIELKAEREREMTQKRGCRVRPLLNDEESSHILWDSIEDGKKTETKTDFWWKMDLWMRRGSFESEVVMVVNGIVALEWVNLDLQKFLIDFTIWV